MENQLEERIKSERSELIRTLSEENRIRYMQSMVGKSQRILIEKVGVDGMVQGYGEHYVPVRFPTTDHIRNRFEDVILNEVGPGDPPTMIGSLSDLT